MSQNSDEIWYFAFGSNMNEKALKRRRVKPKKTYRSKLYGYKFTYNLRGFPFIEPSFATIEKCEGSVVHGVCMLITNKEWENIKATEGGAGIVEDSYQCIEVEVETYCKKKLKAYTLCATSPRVRHTKLKHPPSKRYADLIIEGAESHGLDKEYLEMLKSYKHYNFSEHVRSKLLVPICYFGVLIAFPFVMSSFFVMNHITKSPMSTTTKETIIRVAYTFVLFFSLLLWKWHDILYDIFSPIGLMKMEKIDGETDADKKEL